MDKTLIELAEGTGGGGGWGAVVEALDRGAGEVWIELEAADLLKAVSSDGPLSTISKRWASLPEMYREQLADKLRAARCDLTLTQLMVSGRWEEVSQLAEAQLPRRRRQAQLLLGAWSHVSLSETLSDLSDDMKTDLKAALVKASSAGLPSKAGHKTRGDGTSQKVVDHGDPVETDKALRLLYEAADKGDSADAARRMSDLIAQEAKEPGTVKLNPGLLNFSDRKPAQIKIPAGTPPGPVVSMFSPAELLVRAAEDISYQMEVLSEPGHPTVAGEMCALIGELQITPDDAMVKILSDHYHKKVNAWLPQVDKVHGLDVCDRIAYLIAHNDIEPCVALQAALNEKSLGTLKDLPAMHKGQPAQILHVRWQLISIPDNQPKALAAHLQEGWEPVSSSAVAHPVMVGSPLTGSPRESRMAVVVIHTLRRIAEDEIPWQGLFRQIVPPQPDTTPQGPVQ